jgi:hypothetical protein
VPAHGLSSPRLAGLARPRPAVAADPAGEEHCELCGRPIDAAHRHLVEPATRRVVCACRPCSLLFERSAAAHGQLRLVPEERRRLTGFVLTEPTWAALRIPVDMAFFIRTGEAAVQAFYPSPLGPTESHLALTAWSEVESANPELAGLLPEVQALLVNRTARRPGAWIVPVTDGYRLVAVIRTSWRGFTGGAAVWEQLERFFAELDRRARVGAGARTHPLPTGGER